MGPRSEGKRTLRANIIYAVSGMGLYSACLFLVDVLIAKFASAEIQGQVFLAIAMATPIATFFSLELRGVLVSDANNHFSYGSYQTLRHRMLWVGAVAMGLATLYALRFDTRLPYVLIFIGICAHKLTWFVAEITWGVFQRRERLDLMAWATSSRGLIMLVPLAVALPLIHAVGGTEQAAAWAVACGMLWTATAWLLMRYALEGRWLRQRTDLDYSTDSAAQSRLFLQALPLGLVALIVPLCESVPRLLVADDSREALGYFGAMVRITMIPNLIVIQMGLASSNRIALYYQTDRGRFWRLLAQLGAITLLIGIIFVGAASLAGEWILRIVFTPAYAVYAAEFQIVVLAQALALISNILGVTATQMRLFWLQVPAQVGVLVVTVVAGLLLIPQDPVGGAAKTILIRAAVHVGLYATCMFIGLLRSSGAHEEGSPTDG